MELQDKLFDLEELKQAISGSSEETAVYIGSDSKKFKKGKGDVWVVYVTVVILHYDSSKGAKIFKQYRTERDYGNLRVRLMKEVEDAINVAYDLRETIGDRPMEVHLDINPNPKYASHVCVKEATGYVLGMLGIKPLLKPEAFAASAVSDRWAVKEARKRNQRKGKKYRRISA